MTSQTSWRLETMEQLRDSVHRRMCELNELEPGAFPQTERLLEKRGQACGVFFCLHGPRSVKLTAIWETSQNRILFYSSTGQRQEAALLETAPELPVSLEASGRQAA